MRLSILFNNNLMVVRIWNRGLLSKFYRGLSFFFVWGIFLSLCLVLLMYWVILLVRFLRSLVRWYFFGVVLWVVVLCLVLVEMWLLGLRFLMMFWVLVKMWLFFLIRGWIFLISCFLLCLFFGVCFVLLIFYCVLVMNKLWCELVVIIYFGDYFVDRLNFVKVLGNVDRYLDGYFFVIFGLFVFFFLFRCFFVFDFRNVFKKWVVVNDSVFLVDNIIVVVNFFVWVDLRIVRS